MKNIKFTTRRLTILSADTILNRQYAEPFPELSLFFDEERYNWSFSFTETKSVSSDIGIINNLFEMLKCENTSEMKGRKIRLLLYNTRTVYGKWHDGWEVAGYGAYNSDRFMDMIYGGPIMKRAELERMVAEREGIY